MKSIASRLPQTGGFNSGLIQRGWQRCLGLLLVLLSMAGGRIALAGTTGPALTVTPNAITNDYIGMIEIDIAGAGNGGETVLIEKFFDGNGNGIIDAGELLVGSYQVTDGHVTSIGGQRNLNIPGDEDGASNGQIRVKLPYSAHEIVGRRDGQFIYRVSSALVGGFTPVTATLTITQKDYAGSGIAGTVMAAGSPVPHATVLIAVASHSGDQNIVGLTQADVSGNFSIKLAAGTYSLRGNKAGYVFDTSSAPSIPVVAGTMVTNQVVPLVASGRTISGSVRDATSHQHLPGVLISGTSATGMFSFTFTDESGNFVSEASAEAWKFEAEEWTLSQLGYLKLKVTESSTTSVTGFHFDLPAATALIYGNLATADMPPVVLPFIEVTAMQFGGAGANTDAVTDVNGNYTLGVTTGSWDVGVPAVPNAVVLDQNAVVNTDGSTVLQDLVATVAHTHLKGVVMDNSSPPVPVPNLPIYANDPNSNNSTDVNVTTDASGNFDITVFGGVGGATRTWGIGILFNSSTVQTYVGSTPTFDVHDGVDITGLVYQVYNVTSQVTGQVLDENNAPIGNIAIWANLSGNSGPGANAGTDVAADGTFSIPIFAGNWNMGLSNIQGLGLIPQNTTITVGPSGLDLPFFYAHHANATIVGTVKDTNHNPIVGVQIFGNQGGSGGGGGYSTSATTDNNGHYSMPAFSGTWDVGVSGNDLQSRGYQQPADQNVFLNTTAVMVNFVTSQSDVATTAATGLSSTGATLNGSITASGNDLNTSFQWGSSATALTNTLEASPGTVSVGTPATVSASLSFLTANTTYYFRVLGSDNFGNTIYGATLSFKTIAAVTTPTVTTLAASGITASGATLNGSVNAKGVSTQVLFQGGTSTAYGNTIQASQPTATGITATAENAIVTGLHAHTTYHFRLQGASSLGLANGADLTFKTLDQPPVANSDTYSVLPGAKATLDVLHNDSDPDGDALSILSFTQPTSGGTVAKVGNTLVFTASATFAGGATFTYVASDGFGGTSMATVTLNLGTCSLSGPSTPLPSSGGTYNLTVTAVGAWSVSEVLPWVSVANLSGTGTVGLGSGTLAMTLLPNPSTATRAGTISIGGQSYLVSQAGVQMPTISTPASIPAAIVSGFYSLAIPTTNGPVTYTVTGLPAGLAINQATGVISGTPTVGNVTSHVTVKASNAAGATDPLNPLRFDIVVQSLPAGIVGAFQGLIKRDPVLNATLGSRLELTTSATGSFTGKVITGVTAKVIAGHLIANTTTPSQPECLVSIPRTGSTPLTLDVIFDGKTNTLTGTLSDGGANSTAVNAWRNAWSATTSVMAYQTYYTFSLQQTDTSPSFPQGYGYGSFTVAATTGALTASGTLADGNSFSSKTFVGPQGQVLLYQSLYSNKGSLAGVLTVATGTTPVVPVNNTIAGTPSWYKPLPTVASADPLYPTGFGPVHLTADGGGYAAPTAGQVVMGLSNVTNNAKLTFSGAGIGADQSLVFSLTNPSVTGFINKVTMPAFSLMPPVNLDKVTMTVLTPSSGAFSGGFTIPAPIRTVAYQGQIVYQAGVPKAYGYFLMSQVPGTGQTLLTSPKLSGTVVLGAP